MRFAARSPTPPFTHPPTDSLYPNTLRLCTCHPLPSPPPKKNTHTHAHAHTARLQTTGKPQLHTMPMMSLTAMALDMVRREEGGGQALSGAGPACRLAGGRNDDGRGWWAGHAMPC